MVVEAELAERQQLEVVNVVPNLHAGGSGQVAAFKLMTSPVEVEEIVAHAGIDIGDTSIGMHIKRVQVPLIPISRELGGAHVTALASRPKLIGGARAGYTSDQSVNFKINLCSAEVYYLSQREWLLEKLYVGKSIPSSRIAF